MTAKDAGQDVPDEDDDEDGEFWHESHPPMLALVIWMNEFGQVTEYSLDADEVLRTASFQFADEQGHCYSGSAVALDGDGLLTVQIVLDLPHVDDEVGLLRRINLLHDGTGLGAFKLEAGQVRIKWTGSLIVDGDGCTTVEDVDILLGFCIQQFARFRESVADLYGVSKEQFALDNMIISGSA